MNNEIDIYSQTDSSIDIDYMEVGEKQLIGYNKYKLKNRHYNLRNKMTKLARSTAPVDTGNLKNNGIYSMVTPKGFRIVWDTRFAYYIPFVDEGTYKKKTEKIIKNMNFVERGIQSALGPIKELSEGNKKAYRGFGRSALKYSLPKFLRSEDELYNERLLKSVELSKERNEYLPNVSEDEYGNDVVEYDNS